MLSKSSIPENVIIYLFGFGGTGKLTIARQLQKRLPLIIVDNQFINNTVFSLIDTDGVTPLSPEVWEYVEEIRTTVFQVIRKISHPTRSFVLTNELIEGNPEDLALYHKVVQLAEERGALMLPVRLLVSAEELQKRVQSSERKQLLKSTDPGQAIRTWENYAVLRPDGCFELDVSELSPSEAACAIEAELSRRGKHNKEDVSTAKLRHT